MKEVVDLPNLRGRLDRRKGISPQLKGGSYYDSEYLEVSKSTTDECSCFMKLQTKDLRKSEDAFGVVEKRRRKLLTNCIWIT